jgi:hypothetical protein
MHLPDAWGYIAFGPSIGDKMMDDATAKDPTWPSRLAAIHIYYAQTAFFEDHGVYASNIDLLDEFIDRDITDPFDIIIDRDDSGGYFVEVRGSPDGTVVSVTQDRFIRLGVGEVSKSAYR